MFSTILRFNRCSLFLGNSTKESVRIQWTIISIKPLPYWWSSISCYCIFCCANVETRIVSRSKKDCNNWSYNIWNVVYTRRIPNYKLYWINYDSSASFILTGILKFQVITFSCHLNILPLKGFTFGIGQGLIFHSSATLPTQYFKVNRNLATGIVYS